MAKQLRQEIFWFHSGVKQNVSRKWADRSLCSDRHL